MSCAPCRGPAPLPPPPPAAFLAAKGGSSILPLPRPPSSPRAPRGRPALAATAPTAATLARLPRGAAALHTCTTARQRLEHAAWKPASKRRARHRRVRCMRGAAANRPPLAGCALPPSQLFRKRAVRQAIEAHQGHGQGALAWMRWWARRWPPLTVATATHQAPRTPTLWHSRRRGLVSQLGCRIHVHTLMRRGPGPGPAHVLCCVPQHGQPGTA